MMRTLNDCLNIVHVPSDFPTNNFRTNSDLVKNTKTESVFFNNSSTFLCSNFEKVMSGE